MKASRYNMFFDAAGGYRLAFNSASAALAEIEPDLYPTVQALLAGQEARTPEQQELQAHLERARYLVPDERDELLHLKVGNRQQRFAGKKMALTIAPTMACNLACDYCFERHHPVTMDDTVIEALLGFATDQLRGAESLLVTWFGGEPTLSLPTVIKVQHELRERCREAGVRFRQSAIISNGYKLSGEVARALYEAGIGAAQVTIDGPPEVHDQRRPLLSGAGSFERIVHNLVEAAEVLEIVVRVNVDRENPEAALAVPGVLKSYGALDRVRISFAPVNPPADACADMRARCFAGQEFAELQVALYQQLIQRGFTQIDYPSPAAGGHCAADSDGSFVVGPDGSLFKCWEELSVNPERSVGSVLSATAEPWQEANHDRYLGWDPFEKAGCRECDILPMCMGGCPYQGLQADDSERGICSSWRYNLSEMLQLRYQCA